MKKLARAIVKMRRLILIAAVLLLIPAAVGAIATPINYDILSYLPQELDSRVGQLLLGDRLPSGLHQHDHRGGDAHKRAAGHEGRDRRGAGRAEHLLAQRRAGPGGAGGDAAGRPSAVPVRQERLHHPHRPAGRFQRQRGDDGGCGPDQKNTAEGLLLRRHQCHPERHQGAGHGGDAPGMCSAPWAGCLLVLFLSLESWLTPFLFMLGLLFPLVYNFGTNIFLGQVCFITAALAAVLQLGVTMDFSIFLLHRYEEEKKPPVPPTKRRWRTPSARP